ncbi:MAG: hypothetical protein GXO72_00975 [Caldiserica bacterium]|nr:hypothetical protein [Caldisericota bacterium]
MALFPALALAGHAESWNQIPAPDSPSDRYGPAVIVLDDGRVLRFGGEDYRGNLQNNIFGFFGNLWEPLPTTAPPPARLGASLTQVSDHEVALYGGMGESGLLGDLWILDLETNGWRGPAAGKAPPARKFHVAFFHEGTLYIAGGVGEDGKPRRDLWGYDMEHNVWTRGPDAPQDFWGAYATVRCGPRCSAYVLGPVALAYDPVRRRWEHLPAKGDVPPPKYLAAFARRGDRVHMFGGLYTDGKAVYSTSCHFSYDLSTRTWTYHRRVPPPFQGAGIWGAWAYWYKDVLWIEGGFLGWLCAKLLVEAILSGIHPLFMPDCFPRNERVYQWRP